FRQFSAIRNSEPPARTPGSALVRLVVERPVQPRAGAHPLAPDRALRDAERGGDLLLLHPAEEAVLDDAALPLVELLERAVQREQLVGAELDEADAVVQRGALPAAAALRGVVAPRVVDQDLAHRARRDREQVRAVRRVEPAAGQL